MRYHKGEFADEFTDLGRIANAYNNAPDERMKAIWKKKWYEMVEVIAQSIKNNDPTRLD